jgi:CheY-like chemotaxis protein
MSLPSLKDLHLLVVDDNLDTLQILRVMLEDYQCQVQIAGSAAEALEILQWYKPDVMVCDLSMPDEDGFSLIERVRAGDAGYGSGVPALALTAHVRVDERVRALSAGFNMFVPKPVECYELVTAIANLAEAKAIHLRNNAR